jgi:hypothetical protein
LPRLIERLASDWHERNSFYAVTFEAMDCVKGLLERGVFEVPRGPDIEVELAEGEHVSDLAFEGYRMTFDPERRAIVFNPNSGFSLWFV